ncbi:hypothetical protein LJC00_04180 [Dysgonomonas sp. OttesenSCG-928-M03]|nr:hypothetical protein [Dysgonomonas sp. OttesenSCG-928-M03]
MIQNIWNNIINWFSDINERRVLVREFNTSSRNAFTIGMVPALLEAGISIGDSRNKLASSKFLASGFRIKIMARRGFDQKEIIVIGMIILTDAMLVRKLISLGWDTLEVYDSLSKQGLKWGLINFSETRGLLR